MFCDIIPENQSVTSFLDDYTVKQIHVGKILSMKRQLILHVGLPKTATTSLQYWAYANSDLLMQQGVSYPCTFLTDQLTKHQFIVEELHLGQLTKIQHTLEQEKGDCLFLSTEGMTNHLYDFPSHSLEQFRKMTKSWQVVVFLVVREQNAWLKSFYKQCVLNPPNERYHYATDLRIDGFAQLERVKRLLNRTVLTSDLYRRYGAAEVHSCHYEDDWFSQLMDLLNVQATDAFSSLEKRHQSISDNQIEVFRQVNALKLDAALHEQFMGLVQCAINSNHNRLLKSAARTASGLDYEALSSVLNTLKTRNVNPGVMPEIQKIEVSLKRYMQGSPEFGYRRQEGS